MKQAAHAQISRQSLFGSFMAASISAVLLLAMLSPAFLGPAGTAIVMEAFTTLCHQIAERSPHWHGEQLAACHRCLGIYAGLVVGCFAFLALVARRDFIRSKTGWLIVIAAVPGGVDWLAGWTGVWANTPGSRVVTGLTFGLVAGVCMARAFADTLEQKSSRQQAEHAP